MSDESQRLATDLLDSIESNMSLAPDTLPHEAASLAMEAYVDGEAHVAKSACLDVQAMLSTPLAERRLHILSANVTSWRAQLAPWVVSKQPDVVLLQETKHTDLQAVQAKLEGLGYSLHGETGWLTAKQGVSGG